MSSIEKLKKKNFVVYGLGITGKSVVNYFKRNRIRNYYSYDDNIKNNKKINFIKHINNADFIILSPGIDIKKTKFTKIFTENKHKIISDLDLFYLINPRTKTIVVTGTNGKSTTCKMLEHLLKKNKMVTELGGNIGNPILNLKIKKNSLVIIEASSYQLSYSQFVKPTYALLLNITNDHLKWHGNIKNYINSKFKIFLLQNSKEFALLKQKKISKIFTKKKFKSKLIKINSLTYKSINKKIFNTYLNLDSNIENMSFVYEVSKLLKIKKLNFIKTMNSFKGLPHRHENFLNKKNIKFINDSKATSFKASTFALKENKNIFWILGGEPKLGDKILLGQLKKNIIKCFIIGKNINFFKNQIKKKIKFHVSKTIKKSLLTILKETKNHPNKLLTILLSPASASYDQYKNFNQRGDDFKRLSKSYAKKYL